VLHELTPLASLEGAFMELTSGSVEFGTANRPSGVLCIWTMLALAVAAYLLEHRDA